MPVIRCHKGHVPKSKVCLAQDTCAAWGILVMLLQNLHHDYVQYQLKTLGRRFLLLSSVKALAVDLQTYSAFYYPSLGCREGK